MSSTLIDNEGSGSSHRQHEDEDDDVVTITDVVPEKQSRPKGALLNKRASILNFSRRQSKSMVGMSFEDQVAAIDPSTPSSERLSRLIRLSVTAAGKEVAQAAEEDSNIAFADALADASEALGPDCLEDYNVEAGVKLLEGCTVTNRKEFLPPHVQALRDYSERVRGEAETLKRMKEERKEAYTKARKENIAAQKGERALTVDGDLHRLPEEERRVLESMPGGKDELAKLREQRLRLALRKRKLAEEAQKGRAELQGLEAEADGMARRIFEAHNMPLPPESADGKALLRATAEASTKESAFLTEVKKWKADVLENNK